LEAGNVFNTLGGDTLVINTYCVYIQYWQVSPFELFIFVSAVVITFFTTVEIGLYVSVCSSLAVLLAKIAHPRFSVLGRIQVQETKDGERVKDSEEGRYLYIPLEHDSVKTNIAIEPTPPGVVVFRLGMS
jgi:solute carrier family 26 (sodium-independent sulfate anion transporter), member 11